MKNEPKYSVMFLNPHWECIKECKMYSIEQILKQRPANTIRIHILEIANPENKIEYNYSYTAKRMIRKTGKIN